MGKTISRVASDRAYYVKNAAAKRKYANERYEFWHTAALAALGGKCVHCGISDFRVLQVDHVHGGGTLERKQTGLWSRAYFTHVTREAKSGRYQLLCANCNWIKKHTNNENKEKK